MQPQPVADISGRPCETLRRPAAAPLSAEFLSDLEKVFAAVPGTSGADLQFLASRFDEWRRTTKEFVCTVSRSCRMTIRYVARSVYFARWTTGGSKRRTREHWPGCSTLHANTASGQPCSLRCLRRLSGGDRSDTLRVQRVQSEFQMDGSGGQGRFDVLAEGTWEEEGRGGWMLVIEAKVDAWEGKDQLLKYETWLEANSAGRDVFLAFLTPDGPRRNRR